MPAENDNTGKDVDNSTQDANVTQDSNSTTQDANVTQDSTFSIPDEYKEKPYLQDVKDMNSLLKKLDGAETLLGKKRTVIPTEESSEEEIAEFNKLRGVPDDIQLYEPVHKEDGADNTLFDALRPVFKKSDMTQKQVETFVKDAEEIIQQVAGKSLKSKEEADAEFDQLTEQVFGADKENDLSQAKIMLAENAPDGMKEHIDALDNKSLVVLASVLKNVRAKYIGEDNGSIVSKGKNTMTSADDLRKQGQEQIALANDPSKTLAERDAAAKKAQEIYDEYERISKK